MKDNLPVRCVKHGLCAASTAALVVVAVLLAGAALGDGAIEVVRATSTLQVAGLTP